MLSGAEQIKRCNSHQYAFCGHFRCLFQAKAVLLSAIARRDKCKNEGCGWRAGAIKLSL